VAHFNGEDVARPNGEDAAKTETSSLQSPTSPDPRSGAPWRAGAGPRANARCLSGQSDRRRPILPTWRPQRNGRYRGGHVPTALALIAVGGLIVSACGSTSPKSTSSGSSTSSSTGSYSLGFISDLSGNGGADLPYEQATVGSVKAVNARGGIRGHQLKLIICDSQTNDNADAACGQQLVSDHVFAVIDDAAEPAALPYFQSAGIPDLNIGGLIQEWTSPVSFAINNLGLTSSVGFTALAKQEKCKSFAAVSSNATSPAVANAQENGLAGEAKHEGIDFKDYIDVPSNTPDMSSYVAQAVSKGIDCIALEGSGAQEISMLKAMLSEPANIKVVTGISFLSAPGEAQSIAPIAAQLGKRLIVLTATEDITDTSNSLVQQWVRDQTKYGQKPLDLGSSVSQTLWGELQLLVKAGNAIYPKVTASATLNYLNHVSNFWPGVFPPVSFDKAVPNRFGPRVFAVWIAPTKYVNGISFPRTGPFVDLLTGATSNNSSPVSGS
jgi:ABC-type branched-subunit amino acid transport system substrate-binding protein